jgi:hypothetical protein
MQALSKGSGRGVTPASALLIKDPVTFHGKERPIGP